MSNDRIEAMTAKVRALLAKAEDPAATEPESEAFRAKAFELMAKFEISEAMLDDSLVDRSIGRISFMLDGGSLEFKTTFWCTISDALGGSCFICMGRNESYGKRRTREVVIYGTPATLTMIELLGHSLLVQISTGAARLRRLGVDELSRMQGSTQWLKDYQIGFLGSVNRKLRDQRKSAAASEPGAGLVLMDEKMRAEADMRKEAPSIRQQTSRAHGSAAHDMGRSDGERAQTGLNNLGQRPTQLALGR